MAARWLPTSSGSTVGKMVRDVEQVLAVDWPTGSRCLNDSSAADPNLDILEPGGFIVISRYQKSFTNEVMNCEVTLKSNERVQTGTILTNEVMNCEQ